MECRLLNVDGDGVGLVLVHFDNDVRQAGDELDQHQQDQQP